MFGSIYEDDMKICRRWNRFYKKETDTVDSVSVGSLAMPLVELVFDAIIAIFIANDANCRCNGFFCIALIDAVDHLTEWLGAVI